MTNHCKEERKTSYRFRIFRMFVLPSHCQISREREVTSVFLLVSGVQRWRSFTDALFIGTPKSGQTGNPVTRPDGK